MDTTGPGFGGQSNSFSNAVLKNTEKIPASILPGIGDQAIFFRSGARHAFRSRYYRSPHRNVIACTSYAYRFCVGN